MTTQAEHKGRSLRCPRCQLAFVISTSPVRCPRCGYLIPHEFVEAQSGCLTNFGIGLAMGIGWALWAAALFLTSSDTHNNSPPFEGAFAAATAGFTAGVLIGWILAAILRRTMAEKLALYVCCTGTVALLVSFFGAPILTVIFSAIVIGCPMAMFLWRVIDAHIAAQA
ncbi:MAG: hypothetical protein RMK18_08720 [Armatimonadota bacterium]|nr:hypothetical protein [Armatimonadota bacterium]MCX7777812.1 hypothetical protein [Armatimonadota bacterium]MDW8025926.1 hypothetical protein [Armatimonadota bacterium]